MGEGERGRRGDGRTGNSGREKNALTPGPSPRAPCTHGRGRGEQFVKRTAENAERISGFRKLFSPAINRRIPRQKRVWPSCARAAFAEIWTTELYQTPPSCVLIGCRRPVLPWLEPCRGGAGEEIPCASGTPCSLRDYRLRNPRRIRRLDP